MQLNHYQNSSALVSKYQHLFQNPDERRKYLSRALVADRIGCQRYFGHFSNACDVWVQRIEQLHALCSERNARSDKNHHRERVSKSVHFSSDRAGLVRSYG